MSKLKLREDLQTGVMTIVFEKADGTERVMKCTLKPEFLPKSDTISPSKNEIEEYTLMTVWDMELGAWRSFHFDKIKRIVVGP